MPLRKAIPLQVPDMEAGTIFVCKNTDGDFFVGLALLDDDKKIQAACLKGTGSWSECTGRFYPSGRGYVRNPVVLGNIKDFDWEKLLKEDI